MFKHVKKSIQFGRNTLTLETGAEVNAPAFIDVGETIRINTETGNYMERVKM